MTRQEWEIAHKEWLALASKIGRDASDFAERKVKIAVPDKRDRTGDEYVSFHNEYIVQHPIPPEPKLSIWKKDINSPEAFATFHEKWAEADMWCWDKSIFVILIYCVIAGLYAGDIMMNCFIGIFMVIVNIFVRALLGNRLGIFALPAQIIWCICSFIYFDLHYIQPPH